MNRADPRFAERGTAMDDVTTGGGNPGGQSLRILARASGPKAPSTKNASSHVSRFSDSGYSHVRRFKMQARKFRGS
jgi:hypothetical protein